MRIFLILIFLLFVHAIMYGQNEGNIWYFGDHAGLDFNGGAPVALTNSALNTNEGCATISDSNGALLFYTDGISIWNSNHVPMQNGIGLMGHSSSTQSAIIVKQPGPNTIYYVFTVDATTGPGGLRYTLVDMSLNGGLGAVILASKNVFLAQPSCEKITSVRHANGTDYWVVSHLYGSNTFITYLLNASGLSPLPIISNVGSSITGGTAYTIGYLKASLDGNRIAAANWSMNNAELFDFNKITGVLSNPITFTNFSGGSPYGVEFSPNSQVLYISEGASSNSRLLQYDLQAGTPAAIINSRVTINAWPSYAGAIQLAPDHKIYQARFGEQYLAVVNDPDILGTGCNYVANGVYLGGQDTRHGLPTFYNSIIGAGPFNYNNLCFGDSTSFVFSAAATNSVNWNFGDPNSGINNTSTQFQPTHVFSDTGNFIVTLYAYFGTNFTLLIDTLHIDALPDVDLGNDTTLCIGNTLLLDATVTNATYLWDNNSTDSIRTIAQAGTYWVEVTENNCSKVDSINVLFSPLPIVNLGNDTVLCQGDVLTLNVTLTNASYVWQDNTVNPIYTVSTSGNYSVDVTVNGCKSSDSINVNYNPLPVFSLGNDTALCIGDNLLLDATVFNGTYVWSNNSSNPTLNVNQSGVYWVDVSVNNCTVRDSITVSTNPLPIVELGNDTTLCQGDELILDATNTNATYFWQDSSVNSTLIVNEQGVYSVEVLMDGCLTTDDITVEFESIPVVNLGNDTILCYGESLYLNADFSNSTYLWNGSNTNAYFTISLGGTYWVEVTNMCGIDFDTIKVDYNYDCNCYIYVPNAFSPNGDGKNDFIAPKSNCGFVDYSFQLFDRWGSKVYESTSSREAWDGTVQGELAPQGVYVYFLIYQFAEERRIMKKGSATLIR